MNITEFVNKDRKEQNELTVLNAVLSLLKLKGIIGKESPETELVTYEIREIVPHKKNDISKTFASVQGIRYELIVRNKMDTAESPDESYLSIVYNGKEIEMTHQTPEIKKTESFTVTGIVEVADTINKTEAIIATLNTFPPNHG